MQTEDTIISNPDGVRALAMLYSIILSWPEVEVATIRQTELGNDKASDGEHHDVSKASGRNFALRVEAASRVSATSRTTSVHKQTAQRKPKAV